MSVCDRYGFDKKLIGTHYTELVFFHPVPYVGYVVHSGASGARNIVALFSWSGGTSTDSTKCTPGHVTPNLCCCIPRNLRITSCILVHLGRDTSTHYL
jgi:hypothetical protein